jgi:hypothetical protein
MLPTANHPFFKLNKSGLYSPTILVTFMRVTVYVLSLLQSTKIKTNLALKKFLYFPIKMYMD